MNKFEQIVTQNFDIWSSAVKSKSSVGRGSSSKIELYGVKKLRELILDLAVRGLLVPQDPNDQSSSELLKKIAEEKAKLIKEGKIKKEKPLEPIKEDDIPFDIPNSWEWAYLKELGETQTGTTPSTNDDSNFGDYIPFIGPGDILNLDINYTNKGLSQKGLEKSRLIKKNSIIMVCIGGSIGKSAINIIDIACNQQINTITPYIEDVYKSLFFTLISPFFQKKVLLLAGGSATPIINKQKWESLHVPLPPLEEQKRIVAKVDELMTLCDNLEKEQMSNIESHQTLVQVFLDTLINSKDSESFDFAWKRIADNFDILFTTEWSIDQLKQTILQLAVMGKLVPQDPNDEPASELLKKIAEEKAKLIKEGRLKTEATNLINDNEKYLNFIKGWDYCRLGNLANFIDYRGRTPKKVNSGIPLITAKNVRYGFINREPYEFVTEEEYNVFMTRGFPKKGDLLFTTEAPLGNIAIVNIEEKFALAQRVICLQLHIIEVSQFLRILIMSKLFQTQLLKLATGMTATGIKASKLKEIPIPLPPLEEQNRIVAKVDELMTLCDNLKEKINLSQEIQLKLSYVIANDSIN